MLHQRRFPTKNITRRDGSPQQPKKKKKKKKKKKLKKAAEGQITLPRHTRRLFEERNATIIEFTYDLQPIIKSERGRELERDELDQQWTRFIQGLYPADHPKSYELLAQVESPMYDGYWEKRADEKAFFEREYRVDLYAFNKSRSKPTREQKRIWPGSIIMEDNDGKKFLVPRVSRLALQQVNYVDFVKGLLQANRPQSISRFTMEELWVAVITKIYHFEDALEKELKIGETKECTSAMYYALVEDYRSAYEVAKARVEARRLLQEAKKRERKDAAIEEYRDDDGDDRVKVEEQGDCDQEYRAGKRQKIHESGGYAQVEGTKDEAEAHHVGAEQEKVGALIFDEPAWQDLGGEQGAPPTFHFADTGLALRFKG